VPYKSGAQAMIGLAEGTIDAFTISTYGSNMFLGNDQYRAIMTYSPYKHAIINVPALPKKYQNLEFRKGVAIYGRNLSNEDRVSIQSALNKIDPQFFIENGFYK
jgi:tripartite-type tricarboxylate transporter receptor subunit TctC